MNSSVFIILVTLVIFAIIVIVLRTMRKEKVDVRETRRQQRGFLPIESPPEALINHIRALQPNKTGNIHVTRISQKKTLDGDLYLYDAVIPSKTDSDTYLEDNLIAVSPLLRLPRFILYQLPNLDGKWGSVMNNLAGNIIGWAGNFTGLERIHLTTFPEIDRKFTLLAENEEQVRVFFNAERVQILASLDPNVAVHAGGDSLQITAMNTHGKNAQDILDLEIATAIKLIQSLHS